MHFKIQFT